LQLAIFQVVVPKVFMTDFAMQHKNFYDVIASCRLSDQKQLGID